MKNNEEEAHTTDPKAKWKGKHKITRNKKSQSPKIRATTQCDWDKITWIPQKDAAKAQCQSCDEMKFDQVKIEHKAQKLPLSKATQANLPFEQSISPKEWFVQISPPCWKCIHQGSTKMMQREYKASHEMVQPTKLLKGQKYWNMLHVT